MPSLNIPTATKIAKRVSGLLGPDGTAHPPEDQYLPELDRDADTLDLIASLAQDEVDLIREVLDRRFEGKPVPVEQAKALQYAHRRGLAIRRHCCGDGLDTELSWLQGFGSLALMADITELDRIQFERDLDHRIAELQRALNSRRNRATHHQS